MAVGVSPDRPFVWITVGATDDDPRSFWSTVAAALVRVVGEPFVTALQDVRTADVTELPGRIAAAFTDAGPVLLVLDNLHELRSAAVHEGLGRRISRRPGSAWWSRAGGSAVAPGQAAARRALCEVRSDELAFRPEEAGAMLSTVGTEPRLGSWRSWWTAPRAASSPPSCPGPGRELDGIGVVAALSGNDHSVAGYLFAEVLARAAPPARDLLGKICVPDPAPTSPTPSPVATTGAARLAELEASNLFVQSVGRAGRWYQLHRLVAELLRAQLTDPRQRRDLHRRAAEWHRTNGMPLEALRYALRGGSGARSGCGRGASDVDGRRRRPGPRHRAQRSPAGGGGRIPSWCAG